MTKERIEELIAKKPLTQQEKAEIREAADGMGIEYTIKQGRKCRECYEKLLLKLYEAMPTEAIASLDGFVMRDPRHSFVCLGQLWSNALMAGRNVGTLHPSVRDAYFVKVKKEEEGE